MRLIRLLLGISLAVTSTGRALDASTTGCITDKSLAERAQEADVIVFGTLGDQKVVGYELSDGAISRAAPGFGVSYRGRVTLLHLRVKSVYKGQPKSKVTAYLSLPILNLGDCLERPLLAKQDAVFLLAERSSGYWLVEGRDGIIFTGEQGLPGIIMQFTEPEIVR